MTDANGSVEQTQQLEDTDTEDNLIIDEFSNNAPCPVKQEPIEHTESKTNTDSFSDTKIQSIDVLQTYDPSTVKTEILFDSDFSDDDETDIPVKNELEPSHTSISNKLLFDEDIQSMKDECKIEDMDVDDVKGKSEVKNECDVKVEIDAKSEVAVNDKSDVMKKVATSNSYVKDEVDVTIKNIDMHKDTVDLRDTGDVTNKDTLDDVMKKDGTGKGNTDKYKISDTDNVKDKDITVRTDVTAKDGHTDIDEDSGMTWDSYRPMDDLLNDEPEPEHEFRIGK